MTYVIFACSCILLLCICIFIIYGYTAGLFTSTDSFSRFIKGFGMWAALVFILIQIVQVTVPFLTTSVASVAGILIFGPLVGLLYNYIGICTGSTIAFILSKKYGSCFVKGIVGDKSFDKYISWVDRGKKFDNLFALAIFSPLAPDNLLCYIAGLTKMPLKKFICIIFFVKPIPITVYSLGLTAVALYLFSLLK